MFVSRFRDCSTHPQNRQKINPDCELKEIGAPTLHETSSLSSFLRKGGVMKEWYYVGLGSRNLGKFSLLSSADIRAILPMNYMPTWLHVRVLPGCVKCRLRGKGSTNQKNLWTFYKHMPPKMMWQVYRKWRMIGNSGEVGWYQALSRRSLCIAFLYVKIAFCHTHTDHLHKRCGCFAMLQQGRKYIQPTGSSF